MDWNTRLRSTRAVVMAVAGLVILVAYAISRLR